MRIYLVDTSPTRRGAQVFLDDLANSFEQMGQRTRKAYLYNSEHDVTLSLRDQDIQFDFQYSSFFEKFPNFQYRLLKELAKDINSFLPDIILFNGSRTLKYAAWLKIFRLVSKGKLVGRFIDDASFWNRNPIKRSIYQLWLKKLDAIVGVSQASLNSVFLHYKMDIKSIVIHRTFDASKFGGASGKTPARKSLGFREKDEVLLFLGNITQQKRPDRFVEIVKNLLQKRPNIKALIVGDGPLKSQLQIECSKFGPVFQFYGYQENVSTFISASDVLVLTSDTEGLPGVVLEAAYFDLPTVASDVGGIKECIIDGETGFLISDRSVLGFCEKIDFLLSQPETLHSMGESARLFVYQNFQMKKVANQYLKFFRSL